MEMAGGVLILAVHILWLIHKLIKYYQIVHTLKVKHIAVNNNDIPRAVAEYGV